MPCLELTRVAKSTYPASQFICDLARAMPSCICSSDSTESATAFKIVYLYQKAEKPIPVKSSESHSCFTKDLRTKELYWSDSSNTLRLKAAGMVLGTPLLMAGVVIWHAAALVYNIIAVVARIFENAYNLSKGKETYATGITQLPCIIFERLKEIVAAPFYGVAMEVAMLFATCKPNHGRKLVAMIEHSWRNGVSYKHSDDTPSSTVFYLGWCFQVRGKVIDSGAKKDSLESSVNLSEHPDKIAEAIGVDILWAPYSSASNSSMVATPRTSS